MPKIFSFFTRLSPGPEGQPDSFFAALSLGLYTKTHFHRVRKKTRAYYGLGGKTENNLTPITYLEDTKFTRNAFYRNDPGKITSNSSNSPFSYRP